MTFIWQEKHRRNRRNKQKMMIVYELIALILFHFESCKIPDYYRLLENMTSVLPHVGFLERQLMSESFLLNFLGTRLCCVFWHMGNQSGSLYMTSLKMTKELGGDLVALVPLAICV